MTVAADPRSMGTPPTVRRAYPAGNLRRPLSRKVRVAHDLGISPAQADKVLYGDRAVNRECARIIESDLNAGDTEAATLFLAPIDAACAPRHSHFTLCEALHRAECADAAEQLADEVFRERLRQGTATVEGARELIRKSAIARAAAEEAERLLQVWIDEQEPGK